MTRRVPLLLTASAAFAIAALGLAAPAIAQDHAMHDMPGMAMPAKSLSPPRRTRGMAPRRPIRMPGMI